MYYLAFPGDFELLNFRMMAEMYYENRNRIIHFLEATRVLALDVYFSFPCACAGESTVKGKLLFFKSKTVNFVFRHLTTKFDSPNPKVRGQQ